MAGAWREARKSILNDAVQVHLLPMLEAEARRLLKQKAEEGVLREAAKALQRVVETGACVYKYVDGYLDVIYASVHTHPSWRTIYLLRHNHSPTHPANQINP